nr:ATP-grasp domain-containing protein [Desulforadius tongensis]
MLNGPLNCRVTACDTNAMTLGLYLAHKGYLVPPASKEEIWLNKIIDICRREKIHGILIGSSHEIEGFARHKDYIFQQTGARVFVHSPEVIATCKDKWLTLNFLKENGFYFPQTLRWPEDKALLPDFIERVGFPLVAKPRIGAGSRGVAVLSNIKELNQFAGDKKDYIIQEYLPGDDGEFTVGVCLGAKGTVLSCIALKRCLQDGMTMWAVADSYPQICSYCQRVAEMLGGYGPCNLQLRLKNGKPYIFEINPRFSSSTGMRIALGVKEPELLIRSEILGQKVTKPTAGRGVVIRQYTDYVIPLERVNNLTSSQCFNTCFEFLSPG